jgi:hypothetical protein
MAWHAQKKWGLGLGAVIVAGLMVAYFQAPASGEGPSAKGERAKVPSAARGWTGEWPKTDFSKSSVDLSKIRSGGPPKDGIPAIDDPTFIPVSQAEQFKPTEPVISLAINGDARAYPLAVLMWHEIANDTIGGVPVTVTFCPLCNASIVFDRRVDGQVLDFGTTGKLRRSDLVMYDRQTESWWQQFLGEAIVGQMTGARLKMLPARVESFERFAKRHPKGKVLVPNNPNMRSYGANPYAGYDSLDRPWLYSGAMPKGIAPLARVVSVGTQAWSLDLLKARKRIESEDIVLTWEPGQNSALDTPAIAAGRDIGNVLVQRKTATGLVDTVYGVDFAFAFHAFRPNSVIHTK